jgi:hypothetical protein
MYLPSFPQYSTDFSTKANSVSTSQTKFSELKLNISKKDLTSEFNLDLAFGSAVAFLLAVIAFLLVVIWLQRAKIRRLMAFFHGRPIPPHEDERHLLPVNENESFHDAENIQFQNQIQNNEANNANIANQIQIQNNEANNGNIANQNQNVNNQVAHQNQEVLNVINPEIVHQNQNVTEVVQIIFPSIVPGFRNVTALRAFQKSQRDALKEYQIRQANVFNETIQNAQN